jgi:hypothetical protein
VSRWIRLDTDWSSSEWLAALEPISRLLWPELLCYVKAHGISGRCRPGTVTLRRVTGVTRDAVEELVTAAIAHGALAIEDGQWVVTGWQKYQGDDTSRERSKRYREAKSALSPSRASRVTERSSRLVTDVTPTETETVTSSKEMSATADASAFEEVWQVHRRGPKAKALDEYRKAVPKRITHEQLLEAVESYVDSFSGDFTGAHLYRWIRDSRWEEIVQRPKPSRNGSHYTDVTPWIPKEPTPFVPPTKGGYR